MDGALGTARLSMRLRPPRLALPSQEVLTFLQRRVCRLRGEAVCRAWQRALRGLPFHRLALGTSSATEARRRWFILAQPAAVHVEVDTTNEQSMLELHSLDRKVCCSHAGPTCAACSMAVLGCWPGIAWATLEFLCTGCPRLASSPTCCRPWRHLERAAQAPGAPTNVPKPAEPRSGWRDLGPRLV